MKKKPEHYYNYRLMAIQEPDQVVFEIRTVYYDDGVPRRYSITGAVIIVDNVKDVKMMFRDMRYALKKPILWAGEKFPQEFKPETSINKI